MKRFLPLIGMASALALVAGCADTGYGDQYGYGRSDAAYGYDYGPPAVGFEAFYDDAYGPFYDGYWANDGFYYRSSNQEAYHRDAGGHFRREASNGFHPVTGHAPAHVRAAPRDNRSE